MAQFSRERLTAAALLGAGQFGKVYLAVDSSAPGTLPGELASRAVKLLHTAGSSEDMEDFVREMTTLLDVRGHDNICSLLGVDVSLKPWLAVFELLPYGDLKKALIGLSARRAALTVREQLHLARQVAAALEFVHAKGFVHMDVAARNVLLGAASQVKLTDFGLVRFKRRAGLFFYYQYYLY